MFSGSYVASLTCPGPDAQWAFAVTLLTKVNVVSAFIVAANVDPAKILNASLLAIRRKPPVPRVAWALA
jgi:hypothetical protein